MPFTRFLGHKHSVAPSFPRLRLLILACTALFALLPAAALAHPLGNFTVNRYSRLEPSAERIAIVYIVDMAEIPALQERQRIDTNQDGTVDPAEQDKFATTIADTIGQHIVLTVDGAVTTLIREQTAVSFPPGQGGLVTLRLETRFAAALRNSATHAVDYHDTNFADRIGWSEVVVRSPNATISGSSAPAQDTSDELRNYPKDLLGTPPSVVAATFTFVPAAANITNPSTQTASAQFNQSTDSFSALIATPLTTPLGLLIALGLAFGLGAAHALAPGHGKTIVAAYLVGSRGTAWHAAFLGLTTTVTHTAGVFALGLITLFVSRFVLPERLYPWLGVASGLMVVTLGFGLLRSRWLQSRQATMPTQPHSHESEGWHSHGFGSYHSHAAPASDKRMSMRSLLLLGVSGGLIPCPSALVVLLGAIALGRVGFGLLLIVMFSIGLASVLTLIGVALVYARRFFERIPSRGRLLRLLPVVSALVVMLAGVGVTAQALMSIVRQ